MSRPQVGEGFLLVQQTTQLGNSLIRLFEVTVTKFEVSAELVSVWAAWKNRHDPHASIDIQQSKGVELCVPHITHGQTTTSHLCDPPVEPFLEASNGLLCVPRWAVLHLPGWRRLGRRRHSPRQLLSRVCLRSPSRHVACEEASEAGTGSVLVQPSSACRSRAAAGRAASPSPGTQVTSLASRSSRSIVTPGGRL